MRLLVAAGIAALCLACGGENADRPESALADGTNPDVVTVDLAVTGMTCPTCEVTARVAFEKVAGVIRARVSSDSGSAVVAFDSTRTSPSQFIAELTRLTGYDARVVEPKPGADR